MDEENYFKPTVIDTSNVSEVYMNVFSNTTESFKTISEWNDSTIRFYVIDKENNIFLANVEKQTFEPQAKKLKLKLNDYLKELQLIFNNNKQNYVASLAKNQFSMKRILNEGTSDEMYEPLCDLSLSKANSNDILPDIWNLMFKAFYYHKDENEFQREQSERLKEEQKQSTHKLQELQTAWENEKRDLKHKFLLLLNEKKDRILELRDLLEDSMQSKLNSSMESSSKLPTKRKRGKSHTKIEDSSENVSRNSSPDIILHVSDEDSNESIVDEANLTTLQSLSTSTLPINEPQPSTSRLTAYEISTKANQSEVICNKSSDENSDNLLGESQEAPIIEVKRNRREENTCSNTKLTSNENQDKTIGADNEVMEENQDDVIESSFNLDEYLAKMRN
ncbi:myb-like protein X [Chrysoperla carnea]|uniref:myb-like protein X n=1 Tax=Chrysoperla carnea TaxID=189513 RepID=UPI001D068A77|nr:myb-like protein X [Chrysoperla carnea]